MKGIQRILIRELRAQSFDQWLGIDVHLSSVGTNGGEQVQTRREVLEVVLDRKSVV